MMDLEKQLRMERSYDIFFPQKALTDQLKREISFKKDIQ